jgi:hypothetical protein
VAICLNNLAGLLKATNRRIRAKRLLRRALTICDRSLGPDHPTAVMVRKNLAALEAALG